MTTISIGELKTERNIVIGIKTEKHMKNTKKEHNELHNILKIIKEGNKSIRRADKVIKEVEKTMNRENTEDKDKDNRYILSPCKRCGSLAISIRKHKDNEWYIGKCENCKYITNKIEVNSDEAISEWNRQNSYGLRTAIIRALLYLVSKLTISHE